MTSETPPAMSQKIFNLGLPMVTVSLYLLCCGLADAGIALSPEEISHRWNGTPDEMEEALEALVQKGILLRVLSEQPPQRLYRITSPNQWQGP